ncbi:MAG: RNA 2',3'-cyclic phosphodiesterase [Alphaproteobacteria bacterium]|nr:RNA 2',3'-cyclic phosphodiesterase [Alphaproteobacteria bacterium]
MFLALWPDAEIRRQLSAVARSVSEKTGGRVTPAHNLHITLIFLGALGAPEIEAIRRCAHQVEFPGFTLCLDRLQYRSRAQIAWLGSSAPPAALIHLVDDLGDRLRRTGFQLDPREFRPHVTLVRKARHRPRWRTPAIAWPVTEFALVESTLSPGGSQYRPLARWAHLGGQTEDMK